MSNELIARISCHELVGSNAPTLQWALREALEKAGVRLRHSLDLWKMPEPIPPYELSYCPAQDEIICKQGAVQ